MTLSLAGWILLIYAILLGVGGMIGFLKAGSRPSMIAGLTSALLAILCIGAGTMWPGASELCGAVLAVGLAVFFGLRFQKTRKVMPAGMMAAVSLVVAGLLMWARFGRGV